MKKYIIYRFISGNMNDVDNEIERLSNWSIKEIDQRKMKSDRNLAKQIVAYIQNNVDDTVECINWVESELNKIARE